MAISRAPMLPPQLEGFPWTDYLHMWDYGNPFQGVRLRLFFPYTEGQAVQSYWLESSTAHLLIWEWLEARFVICDMPTLELEGMPTWDASKPQEYSRLAAYGTYVIRRKRNIGKFLTEERCTLG